MSSLSPITPPAPSGPTFRNWTSPCYWTASGRAAASPDDRPSIHVCSFPCGCMPPSPVLPARALADLCLHYDPFVWLAGGVSVNDHTLADFRTDHPELVEQLLNQSVEVLRQQGLIDLDCIAQDGMRVRASAGAASFRRRETLERLLQE